MTTHTVTFYKSKGEFRWRIKTRNGRIVADSGEGYKRTMACHRSFVQLTNAIREGTFTVGRSEK